MDLAPTRLEHLVPCCDLEGMLSCSCPDSCTPGELCSGAIQTVFKLIHIFPADGVRCGIRQDLLWHSWVLPESQLQWQVPSTVKELVLCKGQFNGQQLELLIIKRSSRTIVHLGQQALFDPAAVSLTSAVLPWRVGIHHVM